MTSNSVKPEENRSKRKKEVENEASENTQLSPFEKTDLSLSEGSQSVHKTNSLEKDLNDTSREINVLLSKYDHILSEIAETDASYVEEIEGILKEANSIENYLKIRRERLRHRLTVITGTLQNENGLADK